MPIKHSQEGHWGFFPYPQNFTGDRTNNGGIDLTKEPERINEISELEGLPNLKKAFVSLNTEKTPFMTTGFLHDKSEQNNLYLGYLEFCFKPHINFSQLDYVNFDNSFIQFVLQKYGQQYADFYKMEFVWEMHAGSVNGSPAIPVFSIYYRSRFHEETEAVLLPVFDWLESDFQHLIA